MPESPDQPPGGGLLVVRQRDMGKDSMIPGRQGLKTDTGLLTRELDKGSGEGKIERRQKQENKSRKTRRQVKYRGRKQNEDRSGTWLD